MCLGIGGRGGSGVGVGMDVGKQLPYTVTGMHLVGLVQQLLGLLPRARAVLHGGIEQHRLQPSAMAVERADEGMVRVIGKARLATNAVRIIEEEPVIVA